VSPARRISPGARARRALLVDSILAAIIALLALALTAGLGVVAFFGLPVLLLDRRGTAGGADQAAAPAGSLRTRPKRRGCQTRQERRGFAGSVSARACRSK
jgi:hypothetical protein